MKPQPPSSSTPQTVQHLVVDAESEDSAGCDQLPELGEPRPERSVGQIGERRRDEHEVEAPRGRQMQRDRWSTAAFPPQLRLEVLGDPRGDPVEHHKADHEHRHNDRDRREKSDLGAQ